MAVGLTFVYFAGGWGSPDIVVGPGQGHTLYLLGFVVVAAYVPLYLWRRMSARAGRRPRAPDRRDGLEPLGGLVGAVGSPGGIDLDVETADTSDAG